ncbi:hypothetical protein QCA50_017161 [Cerrena zonata]|uniref:DUF155 domain-containing protein n=1 Tax=Cerrena zonata TaxID=2478898 RepID=A0AAW0FLK6_9APHY
MSDQSDRTPLLATGSSGRKKRLGYQGETPENPIKLPETKSKEPVVNQANRASSKISQSPQIGLQRTSRTTSKLKLLPEDPIGIEDEEEDDDEEEEEEEEVRKRRSKRLGVYSQVKRITDKPARKDAEILSKLHRDLLPRERKRIHNTSPKLFDECLYTPFRYKDWRNEEEVEEENSERKLIRLADEGGEIDIGKQNDIFIFEYGVIIMWGYSLKEEQFFLDSLDKFESEKLLNEDIQIEEFNYYITQLYQPRIYNDFITLRDDSNYMLKLSISHALAQSVKISLFEELVDNTIEDTQDIPQQIAMTGKVEMTRDEIMKSIGELFILRININLHGSVLDSPELMWAEPHLEPIYQATRGYLEINQRVELLNQRLEVISDLLQMLKEQLGHSHEESLEFIVVVLVGIEVLVSLINIIVDILTY